MTAASQALRFWVDMTLECSRRDHTAMLGAGDQRGPFLTARALGMALAALNDARALAAGRGTLLSVPATPGLAGADPMLAGAAACAQVLRARYPKQARFLDPAWSHWLELFRPGTSPGGPVEQTARAFGNAVHALGVADPAKAMSGNYISTGNPYTHIAPPNDLMQGYAGGIWGDAAPLLATRIANFPEPPGRAPHNTPADKLHYAGDFAKVAVKGIDPRGAGTRTLDEETSGIFWGYDGSLELGAPPRLYLQVALTLLDAIEQRTPTKLTEDEEILILAGIAIAMADAGIDAWHFKYAASHMMWRPAVGIPRAVTGDGTPPIPGWAPLGRPDTNGTGLGLTPNFPSYPSGHATFGAAAFQVLRLFLVEKGVATFHANGIDKFHFDFVSDEYNGRNTDPRTGQAREHMTRPFDNLWKAITENSLSRLFLGVHWQFDGITTRNAANTGDELGVPASPARLGHTGGVWLGGQIANQIAPKLGISSATILASKM